MNIFYLIPILFLTPFPFEWKKHFSNRFKMMLQKDYELKYYKYFSITDKQNRRKNDMKQRNKDALIFLVEQFVRLVMGVISTAMLTSLIFPAYGLLGSILCLIVLLLLIFMINHTEYFCRTY